MYFYWPINWSRDPIGYIHIYACQCEISVSMTPLWPLYRSIWETSSWGRQTFEPESWKRSFSYCVLKWALWLSNDAARTGSKATSHSHINSHDKFILYTCFTGNHDTGIRGTEAEGHTAAEQPLSSQRAEHKKSSSIIIPQWISWSFLRQLVMRVCSSKQLEITFCMCTVHWCHVTWC